MTSHRTSDLQAWDRSYLWHPFTQMQDWLGDNSPVIERGEGNYLIDTEGQRYLDGVSSLWCNVHGHRKSELDRALSEQSEQIAHTTMLGLSNVPATLLAKRLVEITPPSLTRVFYSDAGATAVEVALKMALQYWQLSNQPKRVRFVSLTEAYHGDTLGAISVGYSETFHRFYRPVVAECLRIHPPHVYRWQKGFTAEQALEMAIADAEKVLADHADEVAALIVEPLMQGAAGMWAQPLGYLPVLRELTRRHGTLLICDEVATGFGRTGAMFAVEREQVEPDLLCLGKGITGGYLPLAATLASDKIFEAFLAPYDSFQAFFHGHTYTGNPLGCAVALANLDVFEKERVLDRVEGRARQMSRRLAEKCEPLAHVGDVRQWGLMVGLEIVRNRDDRSPYEVCSKMMNRIILDTRKRGVIIRPLGNVVILMPPLSVSEAEVDTLVTVVADSIRQCTES